MIKRAIRLLQTIYALLRRHGVRRLALNAAQIYKEGGPTLLIGRLRRAVAASKNRATGAPVPPLRPASVRTGFFVPAAEFDRVLASWRENPNICKWLSSGIADDDVVYTIVVMPHTQDGFVNLSHTLQRIREIMRGTSFRAQVIVYDALNLVSSSTNVPAAKLMKPLYAKNARELKRLLRLAPSRQLVHFLVSGDLIEPPCAELPGAQGIVESGLILTDLYLRRSNGEVYPILLPGINLVHALNVDYFFSRAMFSAGLVMDLLSHPEPIDVRAMVCRALEAPNTKAVHVAFPILCAAVSIESIEDERRACLNRARPLALSGKQNPLPLPKPRTQKSSIVICTKDNGFLLEQLALRLASANRNQVDQIVVVTNQTSDPYALESLSQLQRDGIIKLVEYDKAFNFSAQCNRGAAACSGDVLVFLNDDVMPVNRNWLEELVAPLERKEVGVVGSLLLYPDQTVQHAGMFLGFNNVAGHTLRGARLPAGDYCFMGSAPRRVMAVTGAALCVRRGDFERLHGFDENLFALHIQDVDLCLRAHFSGLWVVYNPRSILFHMESVSVKRTFAHAGVLEARGREHEAFARRWADVLRNDEFHNPNLLLSSETPHAVFSLPN